MVCDSEQIPATFWNVDYVIFAYFLELKCPETRDVMHRVMTPEGVFAILVGPLRLISITECLRAVYRYANVSSVLA